MDSTLYPDKFNIDDYHLYPLINDIISILHIRSTRGKLKKENSELAEKFSDMLLETSREFRLVTPRNASLDSRVEIFEEVFPSEEETIYRRMQDYAKEIVDLSEEIRLFEKLPRKRSRDSEDLCIILRDAIHEYQTRQHKIFSEES